MPNPVNYLLGVKSVNVADVDIVEVVVVLITILAYLLEVVVEIYAINVLD